MNSLPNHRRVWFPAVFLPAILATGIGLGNEPVVEDQPEQVELLGEEQMPLKSLRLPLQYHDNGTVRAQLFAGAAYIPESHQRRIKARNVRLETYDEGGTLDAVMTTEFCDYNRIYKNIKARLPVRMERRDAVLTGDLFEWHLGQEKLRLSGNVKMVSSLMLGIAGEEALKPVEGEWVPGADEPFGTNCSTITADELVYDQQANTIEFKGNVRGRSQDLSLESDEVAVLVREDNTVEQTVAEGNVRIVRGGRTATCTKATYSDEARTLVLDGEAQVEAEEGSLAGSVIKYWIGDERVECEQGTLIVLPRETDGDVGGAFTPLRGKEKLNLDG